VLHSLCCTRCVTCVWLAAAEAVPACRYAFGKQPEAVEWNLRMLGEMFKVAGVPAARINGVRLICVYMRMHQ
jgi:hypothetical protein